MLRLGLAHAIHAGLLAGAALMLHELVRTRARLVRILVHVRESSTSHSVHGLVLLDWCAVHRSAALSVMHLRRGVHRRLLRVGRLLRWPLGVLLHVVLLRKWRWLRGTALPHVGRSIALTRVLHSRKYTTLAHAR